MQNYFIESISDFNNIFSNQLPSNYIRNLKIIHNLTPGLKILIPIFNRKYVII